MKHPEINHYALVIPLQGDLLKITQLAWDMLDGRYKVNRIAQESPCPHITLFAGEARNPNKNFFLAIQKLCTVTKPFTMRTNGLGVLAVESPLIYIRWMMSTALKELHSKAVQVCKENKFNLDPHYDPQTWLAKATIAFHDTQYSNLGQVLYDLKSLDFSESMEVNKLAIYSYSNKNQEVLSIFNFS